MVGQWGFQPQFQRSERCVLCDWTTGREFWYGYEESNLNLNVRSVLSCPLNDTREKSGWPPRPRTWNLLSQSQTRCQLRQRPVARRAGFEPATCGVKVRRSAELSYPPTNYLPTNYFPQNWGGVWESHPLASVHSRWSPRLRPTPHLVEWGALESPYADFQPAAKPSQLPLRNLVEDQGIEPC